MRNAALVMLTVIALACGVWPVTPVAAQSPDEPATGATATIRELGLIAEYFTADPATASPGAVIVLGGSEGGLQGSRPLAQRLAQEGFDAIAVSYFGEEGQPSMLNEVPIEPVGRAIQWLMARADGDEPIAVVGASKGGELALLIASRDPRIRAVVAGVPSSVVWQGIDMRGGPTGSSWTVDGQPIAYTPYDFSQGFRGVYQLYADSLANAPEEAVIAVEQINGPVMLISGADDTLWPSSAMVAQIADRLAQHGFRHIVEQLVYPAAGHAAFGPPVQLTPQIEQQVTRLGGTVEGNLAAREDGWPRVLAFLRTALVEP